MTLPAVRLIGLGAHPVLTVDEAQWWQVPGSTAR